MRPVRVKCSACLRCVGYRNATLSVESRPVGVLFSVPVASPQGALHKT